jgi:hypothetical protein
MCFDPRDRESICSPDPSKLWLTSTRTNPNFVGPQFTILESGTSGSPSPSLIEQMQMSVSLSYLQTVYHTLILSMIRCTRRILTSLYQTGHSSGRQTISTRYSDVQSSIKYVAVEASHHALPWTLDIMFGRGSVT